MRIAEKSWTGAALAVLLFAVCIVSFAILRFSGRLLVIDQPERAEVILVIDGDSNDLRFQRAVNLPRKEGNLMSTGIRRPFNSSRKQRLLITNFALSSRSNVGKVGSPATFPIGANVAEEILPESQFDAQHCLALRRRFLGIEDS